MVLMREGHRTCNAKCYHAKGDRCTCVCGGRNHGIGEVEALERRTEREEGVVQLRLWEIALQREKSVV